MNVSTKLTLVLALLTVNALTGCVNSQPSTATDRLKEKAAECAGSLAGESLPKARKDCLAHLAQLEAALNWQRERRPYR